MSNYNLTLTPSELETIETLINITIPKIETMASDTSDILDNTSLSLEEYNMYLGCLANMTRDMANMRSILAQVAIYDR